MRSSFERRDPHHEIFALRGKPTLVYLTLAIDEPRLHWVATDEVHALLREIWTQATAWCVADYMLMPDHLHCFAYPGMADYSFRRWLSYWKREFTRAHQQAHRFQTDYWDMTIRSSAQYTEKYDYMRQNPVRKGLVERPEDWPFQGKIHNFVWTEI